ncbi:hypothetical protein BH20ACI2_BH20ACI2_25900 [soil metagenome]
MNNEHPEYDARLGDLTGPDFTGMSEEQIIEYWKNSTVAERLREVERLRRLTWGLKALEPIDKTRFEIIDMSKY